MSSKAMQQNPNKKTVIKQKRMLVILSWILFLHLFSYMSYLTALMDISQYFDATLTKVALSVSLYQLTLVISPLVMGPASDFFGRRTTLLFSLFFVVIFSALCYFSVSINLLIIFRTLQGWFIVGSKIFSSLFFLFFLSSKIFFGKKKSGDLFFKKIA
ncbi:polyamine transporter 2-related [Anaeramoeba flamelloides]|uniref:Polyamine transporter 2-related n=1 Tax=Anaeramoeba flamelloides TaxID=1746091 RepID=A0AAV7Z636_9EUKA|nr:polyamine transporter 2-related [Anaeramoeba flamelloides]